VYNQTGDIQIFENNNYITYFRGENSATVAWSFYYKDGYVPSNNFNSDSYWNTELNENDNESDVDGASSSSNEDTNTESDNTISNDTTVTTDEQNNNSYESKPNNSRGNESKSNIQGGTILHAFCWTYDTIKENMADIAAAGYTAVQTSPVQQAKDYDESYTVLYKEWWKLYQPLSYTIADKGWLGTKQDLIEMCAEAKKYNVEVICDIVANHLAADNTDSSKLNKAIATYEPEIYNNPDTMLHNYINCDESSVTNIVQGNVGMPDVNTGNDYIQNRVISLLKELIDCGVTGFRFDAAKHIETTDDGNNASDFWPTITRAARNYGKLKNKHIYMYGEILSPMMAGREYSSYTKYINVIDNRTGDLVLNAVYNQNAGIAADCRFNSGEKAKNLVLWAESHDTYMGESQSSGGIKSSKVTDEATVNKAWAIVASRTNATSLFLARPSDTMGEVGSYSWKSPEVAAVNYFHNEFKDSKEYLSSSENYVINERYYDKSSRKGAIIVNTSASSLTEATNITVNKLEDGTYIDSITQNKFTVKNGKLSGVIGSTGIAVLYKYN
jgi:alpha-amylase